jgi:hypothetical protein
MEALEVKALNILANMQGKQIDDLVLEDLNVLLSWHGLAIGLLKNEASKVA